MPAALGDLKIVELGEMVSAPYATKLMADMGAEVIKIERPGSGDPARKRGPFPGDLADPDKSGLFLYLNTNKLGVTLEVGQPRGFELLERLVAGADLFLHNLTPPEMDRVGLGFDRLRRLNPKLVMTSVTPFGLSGPYRNYRAGELTVWCAGGVCYLNGGGPEHPELPPLKTFGHQAGYQAGVHAAVASMGALWAALRDGEGQHVELSGQETIAAGLEMTLEFWPYMGMIASRLGAKPLQPIESMQCKDGWIYLCCIEEHQWRAFVDLMGNPEWASEEIFSDRLKRGVNWDALRVLLQEWVGQQTALELYRAAQARRIPFAPVSTMGDLLCSEHLRARGFFVEITQPVARTHKYPGAPLKYSRTPWEIRLPAPTLGQHNEQIYCGRLGLGAGELAQLRSQGII